MKNVTSHVLNKGLNEHVLLWQGHQRVQTLEAYTVIHEWTIQRRRKNAYYEAAAAILVLPVLYTILVLPVFYHNLPVSAILVQILVAKIWVLQIPEDSRKYWLYQYCRYWKILENTGYTSIADTGRFWKIPVIPVLQIL